MNNETAFNNVNLRMDKGYRKREFRRKVNLAIRYAILTIGAIIMLYPIVWLVGASFKTNSEIFSSISFIPKRIDFTPYIKGWKTGTQYTFATYYLNTFKYVIPKVIFTVVSSVLTAYGFSRFNFPFKKPLFAILISTMFLPQIVLRIPLYLLWKQLHLLDTFVPLYANDIFAAEAFFVFMIIQFMRGIPKELDEAAKIDGCNSFTILTRILLPVITPAIVSVTIFQFMWSMNDFMGPLIYISTVSKYPVSIALKMAMDATSGNFEWNKIIAMSVIALIPSIVVFFSAQKYFVEGISTSGLKG
ncbi:carbohydrate ABC transporter permease [Thermoanaerobacterium sp. R66]|uniref:carbohydrate ABC transporter permease n=1 Tax=Thermoanaerobacterium sp. R66 TaxID=2742479 RepID=UPI0023800287|nr:carbohydrate ABC transporter permease [Thermoanaerobacterium sp. R66]MDE4542705.1 carbohydrate ABC transporter permease [Thermoanaerobacterium sp. R66]